MTELPNIPIIFMWAVAFFVGVAVINWFFQEGDMDDYWVLMVLAGIAATGAVVFGLILRYSAGG